MDGWMDDRVQHYAALRSSL